MHNDVTIPGATSSTVSSDGPHSPWSDTLRTAMAPYGHLDNLITSEMLCRLSYLGNGHFCRNV